MCMCGGQMAVVQFIYWYINVLSNLALIITAYVHIKNFDDINVDLKILHTHAASSNIMMVNLTTSAPLALSYQSNWPQFN